MKCILTKPIIKLIQYKIYSWIRFMIGTTVVKYNTFNSLALLPQFPMMTMTVWIWEIINYQLLRPHQRPLQPKFVYVWHAMGPPDLPKVLTLNVKLDCLYFFIGWFYLNFLSCLLTSPARHPHHNHFIPSIFSFSSYWVDFILILLIFPLRFYGNSEGQLFSEPFSVKE